MKLAAQLWLLSCSVLLVRALIRVGRPPPAQLACWSCNNKRTNNQCLREGIIEKCARNRQACHNEIRNENGVMRILKRCKQPLACDNNEIQNPVKKGWDPKSQCNPYVPNTVCRCCCYSDQCNKDGLFCMEAAPDCGPIFRPMNGRKDCTFVGREREVGAVCEFSCNKGFALSGAPASTCVNKGPRSFWNRRTPRCISNKCRPDHVAPENGAVDCSDGSFRGSVCSFTCKAGYFLDGEPASTCNDNAKWSSPAPVCRAQKCLPVHTAPQYGSVTCSNANMIGSRCAFACKKGYARIGARVSACEDDFDADVSLGSWSAEPPTCQQITCPPPRTAPANGGVSCSDGINFASTCRYSCDVGFSLAGSASTTCMDDNDGDAEGIWNRPAPTCRPITCPLQQPPENGFVDCSDDNNHNSNCQFSCIAGYILFGSPSTLCVDDGNGDDKGVWNKPRPRCELNVCMPRLGAPRNGIVECSNDNSVGSVCNFLCDDGYLLEGGNDFSTCQTDGSWSDPVPRCTRIVCQPKHTRLSNGRVSCSDSNNLNSKCTFVCNVGYAIVEEPDVLTCNDDNDGDALGEWSSPPPTCQPVRCMPVHSSLENGRVSCSNGNLHGSVCRWSCDGDYLLAGSPTTRCADDNNGDFYGQWSEPPPTCTLITCPPPLATPVNGAKTCSAGISVNSVCEFTCDDGYFMAGSPVSICEDDMDGDSEGYWTDEVPTCTRITCLPPHTSLRNGAVSCTDTNNRDSVCTFVCDEGFQIVEEPDTTTCNDDGDGDALGEWSNPVPTCNPVRCQPQHRFLENGAVSCTNRNFHGSDCSFSCNSADYRLDGAPVVSCADDNNGDWYGLWSDDPPVCTLMVCSPPHAAPTNGRLRCTDSNRVNSVCSFACDAGYFMTGAPASTCARSPGGVDWTSPAPTCGPIVCNASLHDTIENGRVVISDGVFVGSVYSYQCREGFQIVEEPNTATCMDDGDGDGQGVFSNPRPTCNPVRCQPNARDPANGAVDCTNRNFHGSVCTYTCDAEYELVGSPTSRCEDDDNGDWYGLWNSDPPICKKIVCDDQGVLENGEMVCTNGVFQDSTCSFRCTGVDYFLYPQNSDSNTCMDDNNWDKPKPCCTRKCPPYAMMDLTVVMDSSSSVGTANWVKQKEFVKNLLMSFNLGDDAARMSVFRYNRVVDSASEIKLGDVLYNKTEFMRRFDAIPYDGSGTRTGQALVHAREHFAPGYGNRAGVRDVCIVITDGRSQDDVAAPAKQMRNDGVYMFAIGIGLKDNARQQMYEITGDDKFVVNVEGGFAALGTSLIDEIGGLVCGEPCSF